MNPTHTYPYPFDTISESGKAPESRVKNADDAYNITETAMRAGGDRSRMNAQVRGMFDGNPPYSVGKLKAEAQSWRANVNFLEGKAARSAALVPYYDLFAGAKFYSQVELDLDNKEDAFWKSSVVTEMFDWMLRSYDGFDFNMQQMLNDYVGYGKGFLGWEDTESWFFKCIPQHRVYVPDGTDAYSGNIEVLVIQRRYRTHEIWDKIKDGADTNGWDKKGVVAAIRRASPEKGTDKPYDYEVLQQKFKDRDLAESYGMQTVPTRHLLVREFNGKVSHFIVEDGGIERGEKREFLYENIGRYDDFNQAICAFFLETGDGSWNGARGLGHDIYSIMSLKDRVRCSMVDLMFLRTGVNLQARTATSAQKAALIRYGPVNVIPDGFDVQQATILGDIESPVLVNRALDEVVTNNTGVYRQRMEKAEGNPRTAEEVRLQYQTQAVLSNSGVNRFYLCLDKLYAEIYRRAVQPAIGNEKWAKLTREFQEKCQEYGITIAEMREVASVKAYRNAGNGSIFMRKQNIAETMQFLPLMPESGKSAFIQWAIASINGQSMAQQFFPREEAKRDPADQMALAQLENAALKIGSPVIWTDTQNNVVHAQAHLQAGAQAAQSLQQGANPQEVAAFIEQVGAHVGVHLSKIENDPSRKDAFDALKQQWDQLATFADNLNKGLAQVAAKQQHEKAAQEKARAIMAGQDPDAAVRQATALQDMRIKQRDAASKDARARRKDAQDAAKFRQNMQMDAAKARQDLAIKDAQAAADIHIAKKKAEAAPKKPASE